MPKHHVDLFDKIASFPALHAAARRAIRGKRGKPGAAAFMANLERELLRLVRQLNDATWRPGRYVEIPIRDPKPRLVSAAPFRDRVVHHALCAVLAPIWERGFIDDSYANRAGFGTHRAIARYEQYRDRYRHVLRADIFRFFPAIDHAILKAAFRRRIACERTLWLLDAIVDGSNPQEPVNLYFPGDDLFSPFERRRGLPIGNLTSQFLANVYLNGFDHWVQDELRPAGYVRYMDDMVFFHDDRSALKKMLPEASGWLTMQRGLRLKESATRINQRNHGLGFLGVRIFPELIRVRRESLRRCLQRLSRREWQYQSGWLSEDELAVCAQSAVAHLAHWNSHALRRSIFKGDHHRRLPSRQSGRRLHQCRGESARSQPRQQ